MLNKCFSGYDRFEFYEVFHCLQRFCIVDMSNFYLDVIKDRLYAELQGGYKRRSAQTTIYMILKSLFKTISPILSFTAEEIRKYIPKRDDEDYESVFLGNMPEKINLDLSDEFLDKWNKMYQIKDELLEVQRKSKVYRFLIRSCCGGSFQ